MILKYFLTELLESKLFLRFFLNYVFQLITLTLHKLTKDISDFETKLWNDFLLFFSLE